VRPTHDEMAELIRWLAGADGIGECIQCDAGAGDAHALGCTIGDLVDRLDAWDNERARMIASFANTPEPTDDDLDERNAWMNEPIVLTREAGEAFMAKLAAPAREPTQALCDLMRERDE
jgi:hypothetical protein